MANDLKILTNPVPPSVDKLKLLAANPDTVDIALDLIAKHKMPYIVVGNELRSAYSQGELYLQKFITVDPDTLSLKQDAMLMAKTSYEVLVTGPTGTGKEILSKSMIADKKGQIKIVNCAGMPSELIESELFGHVRGSFTGATDTRDGLITLASEGVMFMDEIGELPLEQQPKLLRCLQDRTLRKVGGKTEEKVNCKFVFATNRNLRSMVQSGSFREDLYARISTLELDIKPLKERMCDVIPITESLEGGKKFLEKYGEELSKGILDISLNVRSIQQYVIRYNVLGRLTQERVKS